MYKYIPEEEVEEARKANQDKDWCDLSCAQKTSMTHNDMDAFIFNAKLNNDFHADYNDEF